MSITSCSPHNEAMCLFQRTRFSAAKISDWEMLSCRWAGGNYWGTIDPWDLGIVSEEIILVSRMSCWTKQSVPLADSMS